ncbi:UDP-4-amino-4,6-dideoxy-N-acetyl-beta-L-altrosamine transaminase [uncultured Nitratireductor sp.]|uniref:UDP-4-amino-4, 6-dideoxy-N-acetyl-beta-L-altrosamine transaminase n=1 Tax=uncultured Nitratireductor sp. TaxID=520953 RepID=UPI00260026AD|nr:UDP-4-amino-4,6-dideoxy-N-acetyl-beta-L-altrosamine transaminase [uncultured Nitratireductor sp.]
MIPYGRQHITDRDVDAVVEVLRSPFLTQGPAVPLFEAELTAYTGAAHAVAANSATSALHIAYRALGLGEGDSLWTSPNTFVATANAALYCGAKVDFVDIDPLSYNMSVEALAEKLSRAEKNGSLPKIVSVVHFAGQSCDMAGIAELADKYGFYVVEDASHAIGATYGNVPVGRCAYSSICVFSFHPVKIITTAEGGAATTNDPDLAEKMRLLRSHGVTRERALMRDKPDDQWYYEQVDLGFNYRMTDIQAALGVSQMARLDEYVAKRHDILRLYSETLKGLPLILPHQPDGQRSALHLYPVQIAEGATRGRREVFDLLRADGVGVNVHYIPVHTQPYYRDFGFKVGDYPEAEAYYSRAISLPMFPQLTDEDIAVVTGALEKHLAS